MTFNQVRDMNYCMRNRVGSVFELWTAVQTNTEEGLINLWVSAGDFSWSSLWMWSEVHSNHNTPGGLQVSLPPCSSIMSQSWSDCFWTTWDSNLCSHFHNKLHHEQKFDLCCHNLFPHLCCTHTLSCTTSLHPPAHSDQRVGGIIALLLWLLYVK